MSDSTDSPSTCLCTSSRIAAAWKLSLFGLEDYNGKIIDVQRTFAPKPMWLVLLFRIVVLIWVGNGYLQVLPLYTHLYFFIYYTHWSFMTLTLYEILAAATTIQQMVKAGTYNWLTKATWFVYSIGAPAQLFATVLYWAVIHSGHATYTTKLYHGYFAVVAIFDGAAVSRIPVRLKSFIPFFIFNNTFLGWTIIHSVYKIGNSYSGPNDDAIYPVMSWSTRPGEALKWSALSELLFFPVIFFVVYMLGSIGGGCKFDGSARRYVTKDGVDDEEAALQPAAVYGSTV